MTKQLKLKDRLKIKKAIENKEIPEDVWPLLEQLFESNEWAVRRATKLAWKLEEQSELKREKK